MTDKEICECGLLIRGISEKHLKFQMQTHKRGKKHKELMKFLKEVKNRGEDKLPPTKLQDKE